MNQSPFKLHSAYVPTGDQPEAIDSLVANLEAGVPEQILLGVTGSGKTFTMANVIARCGRPALVLAPNKTLAAQLYNEFREIFPAERCGVFRQLLRLLPAGSLCARLGHLHRERFVHQRQYRQIAPCRDPCPADTARCDHRGFGLLHLRPGLPRILRPHDHPGGSGAAYVHGCPHHPPGGSPV